MEVSTDKVVCYRCGKGFAKAKGFFPVSYAVMYRGVGHLPYCRECLDQIYMGYLAQCNDAKAALRQTCRKLDVYWSEAIYNAIASRNTNRTLLSGYMQRVNSHTTSGKSYDDTLASEGTLWSFSPEAEEEASAIKDAEKEAAEEPEVPEEIRVFWGSGYSPSMYHELEQRRKYWMSRLSEADGMDAGKEALIRQICALELDINRDRAAGRPVTQSVTTVNTLLGSLNLKPVQKKQDEADLNLAGTPLGVWLMRYEKMRPLPEPDDEFKDVNGIRKHVFTWLGHICKMMGIKNGYSDLYESEIERLRVERPEYDGEDDEAFMTDLMEEGSEFVPDDISDDTDGEEPVV